MKIGLIRYHYTPYGGAELHLGELTRALIAGGHEVTIVAQTWEGAPGDEQTGFEKVILGKGPGPRYRRLRAFCRAAGEWLQGPGRDLDVSISADRVPGVDIFWTADGSHVTWLSERSKYISPLKAITFRINPLHRTHLALEREMLTHPAMRLVIANSALVRRDLLRYYSLEPDLIQVLPSGIDPQRMVASSGARESVRTELNLGESPTIIFVGSNFKRKGLVYAIRALAEMNNREALLVAVGRDKPKPYLNLAQRLGVVDRIRFTGVRSDVSDLLFACNAFVLPTIYDPGAISCLEAMVAGLPVVTTTANGSSEFIEPGRNGFILDRADDIPGLAEALDKALLLKPGKTPIPTLAENVAEIIRLLEKTVQEKRAAEGRR